ncbi:Uncharacterised protein [Mycobacteroides abscessus subsp. abscessus]|nr:Uncharacterised protein [Mycobacteroides abscessus subsp. abscessus]SIK62690.1 Uncharacterised protein [Mycobacteroides abscessus subsp. abscessus]
MSSLVVRSTRSVIFARLPTERKASMMFARFSLSTFSAGSIESIARPRLSLCSASTRENLSMPSMAEMMSSR